MIKVKLLGSFTQGIGKEVDMPSKEVRTVKDVLERLRGRNSEVYPGNPNIIILVNGVEVGVLKGLDTELKDGDKVVLLPAAHGGSVVTCFSVEPQDGLLEKVEEIRRESGAIVQVCLANCLFSERQVEMLALQTIYALKHGELLADKAEMDFLMRVSLEDQIDKAIEKCGYKGRETILVIFGEGMEKAVNLAHRVLSLGPPSFSSKDKVMKVHGVERRDLEAYMGPDRPLSLMVERAALLYPRKR